MPLNAKQQEACEYLEGPLLVLAGPGTGKTQLLANKVEYILSHTDANPENILCLTFTDAGVTAMRERLLSMQIDGVNRINIFTYHSFGTNVLMSYKNYAEQFDRNLDHPINPVIQYKIIKDILASLPANDILRSGDASNLINDLLDTIKDTKSARLTPADLQKIATYNLEKTAVLNPLLDAHLQNLIPRMKFQDAITKVYRPLALTLAEHISDQPITKDIYPEANYLLLSLNTLIEAEEAKEKPSIRPLSKWKDANFEKDDSGHFRLSNRISNKKLLSLAHVIDLYDQKLAATGQFDFSDMIEEAIKALKTDPGFKATLAERYQYILLDEFQDTNPSQFEIVRLLTDYEKPCIMAVGDDDQAIYAFQGANSSNLLDFYNFYQAKVITLTENYRSTSEILDFSRKIADQISDSFAKNRHTAKVLSSVRNSELMLPEAKTQILRHEFMGSDSEYAFVAAEVHRLCEQGVSQNEIAIIAPKHKYIAPLLPYLKEYEDINISYEKRENILEDELIRELCILLRFVNDLANDKNPSHRLLEILSFEFWGLDPLEVMNAIQGTFKDSRRALDFLVESQNQRLKEVAEFLAKLTTASFTTPLEQLLSLATQRLTSQLSENDTLKFYEQLAVLHENLLTYLDTDKPRLKDFIAFLDDYEAASATILNTSPYADSTNSIQILSAHKSKGLEFKYVFLISVDSQSWGKGKGNNNRLSLPKNLESIRHTGITEDEQLRLLFVAITRAKSVLYLTNSLSNFAGQSPKRLEYLKEYAVDEKTITSPLLPDPNLIEHYQQPSTSSRLTSLKNHWLSFYSQNDPISRTTLVKRLENYRLSASDLTTFVDIIYAGPMEFYKRKVLRAPSEPATAAIHLGNLVHTTFEAVTNTGLSNEQALQFFLDSLDKLDLPQEDYAYLKERGGFALESSLQEFSDILRHPHAKAELNLAHEHLILPNNIPITGKIDHIHLDSETKTAEIYDFKTGNFHDTKWESNASLFKYALQLGFYKLLLNTSPTYSQYRIEKAHILFVVPDSDGKVYDKIYEFTPENEAFLLKLITAVYKNISSLNFLDEASPFHLYADSSRSVKNIREFCDTIISWRD